MKINFYLKDKNSKTITQILLSFSYNGKRLRYPTGISTKTKSWNNMTSKVYSGVIGSVSKNTRLSELESTLSKAYQNIILNNEEIPKPNYFKQILDEKFNSKLIKEEQEIGKEQKKTFFNYYDEFIESKKTAGANINKFFN